MPKRRSPKKRDTSSDTKWKSVSKEDVEDYGFVPMRGKPKWNTYREVEDLTRWRLCKEGSQPSKVNSDLSSALARSYADRSSSSSESVFRVPHEVARRAKAFRGTLQIPSLERGSPSVVTFKPGVDIQIPNEPLHMVQRRFNRCTDEEVTEEAVTNLITKTGREEVKGFVLESVVNEKGKVERVSVSGGGEVEVLYP